MTPEQALALILDAVQPLRIEATPLEQALGRTLGSDIKSEIALPPFDNSAMDGYAVIAAATEAATAGSPLQLHVAEMVVAGAVADRTVGRDTCCRIMTGAPLPPGADAVVMQEDVEAGPDASILLREPIRTGRNIRRAGSDVALGEIALRAGSPVRAAEWGMLASLGVATVPLHRQPRVVVLATGDELVDPSQRLEPGQIHDSNSYTLEGLVSACGGHCLDRSRTGDSIDKLRDKLLQCAETADAIVTSGGVSVGQRDPVRDVLQEIAEVVFWKIAMKPGKPVMFALLHGPGGRHVPIFGLPGNPVSVMVAFEQFVRPALLRLQGRRALRRVTVQATVDVDIHSPAGKTDYIRALVSPDADGWRAAVSGVQSSGRLSTMTRSNALLLVPPEVTAVPAGAHLTAQMTDWPEME